MIIEPGSELGHKDIEAQRGATRQLSQPQNHFQNPSASTSASAALEQHVPGLASGVNDSMLVTPYPDLMFPGSQEPLGPPPAFTPYEAEWFEVGQGDVVSHDEHLNTDGEALYRFLLTQAIQRPPRYRIHCRGTHTETRYRFVTSHSHHHHDHHSGHHHSRGTSTHTESYSERVTDFDFYIDVTPPFPSSFQAPASPPISPPVDTKRQPPNIEQNTIAQDDFAPIHWSVADNEPVHRGKMIREVETLRQSSGISLPETDLPLLSTQPHTQPRKATRRERKDYTKWIKERTLNGLPPWATPSIPTSWNPSASLLANGSTMTLLPTSREVLKSSKTMREWADEYCSSPKLLKEFVYTKCLYGWDMSQLLSAIRSTIALTPYQGDIEVDFIPINSKIYIRPSNRLSRALSNAWLKFVSIILFIFPFIWLFKMFHKNGGGKWEVCGGAYALKRMIPVHQADGRSPSQGSPVPLASSSGSSAHNELPSYEDVAGPSSSSLLTDASTSLSTSFPDPSPSITTPFSPQPGQTEPVSHTRIIQTPHGPYKVIGQREGEWFRFWEPVIIRSVLTRYQSSVPLTSSHGGGLHGRYAAPGSALEGYHDAPTLAPAPTGSAVGGVGPGGLVGFSS